MQIIRHIKVDLYGAVKRFAVAAKQMEMGTRYIGVTLMENGVVYEIPNDAEIIINMTKSGVKRGSHSADPQHAHGSWNGILRGTVVPVRRIADKRKF